MVGKYKQPAMGCSKSSMLSNYSNERILGLKDIESDLYCIKQDTRATPVRRNDSCRLISIHTLCLVGLLCIVSIVCSFIAICETRIVKTRLDEVEEFVRCNNELIIKPSIRQWDNLSNFSADTKSKILASTAVQSLINSTNSDVTKFVLLTRDTTLKSSAGHLSGAIVSDRGEFAEITSWTVVHIVNSDQKCQQPKSLSDSEVIGYKNGRLVTSRDGFYFVYSQVQFLTYPASDARLAGHTRVQLSHSIWKWNSMYPNDGNKMIAQRSLSVRWQLADVAVDEQASYIGGLFEIQQGDQLFVQLSNYGILNDTTTTFFGMYSVIDNTKL